MQAGAARPRWTTLASVGFAMIALGSSMYLIAGLVWGLGGATFFIPFFVVTLVVAYLVRRFGVWAKILGIVIALLSGFALFWTALAISAPASFFDFVPAIAVMPGAIMALSSCIGSLVAKKREHYSFSPEGAERTALRVVIVAVPALALLSGILTVVSRSTAPAAGVTATVVQKNFKFVPTTYTIEGGSTILVKNNDPFRHTFTIDALGIDVTMNPGSSKLVPIPPNAGTYVLYCKPHGTPKPDKNTSKDSMNGTVTVT